MYKELNTEAPANQVKNIEMNRKTMSEIIEMISNAFGENIYSGCGRIASYGQDPVTGKNLFPKVQSFTFGDLDSVINTICHWTQEPHRNVYMPLVLLRDDLPSNKKGSEQDIIKVLGLVADFDDDAADKWAERLPIEPSYVLETSENRYQAAYLFKKPMLPAEAKNIAAMLQEFSKCDFGTKDLSHIWRIPGTYNWPNKKKVDEGRSANPQIVKVVHRGDLVDPWELNGELEAAIDQIREREKQPEHIFNFNNASIGHSHKEEVKIKKSFNVNDDIDFLKRVAFNSKKHGDAVKALFNGDTGKDASAADMSLCHWLAFYLQKDYSRIDAVFRQSGLMRPKWDEVHYSSGETYGQRTIQTAINKQNNTYNPNYKDDSTPEEWPEPLEIKQSLLPVMELPDKAIPVPFKAWIKDIAYRWAVPKDFPFIAAILTTGSIIGTGCRVRPKQKDDWEVVPNTWGGVIAPPSKKKTPVLSEIVNKSIGKLQKKADKEFEKENKSYEAEKFILDTRIKFKKKEIEECIKNEIKAEVKDAENKPDGSKKENSAKTLNELRQELNDLEECKVGAPKQKIYKVNACTMEKFAELCGENPKGLMYFADELIKIFLNWERDEKEGKATKAFFMESHEGKQPYTDAKIGRGVISAKYICSTVIGGIQPEKIFRFLRASMLEGDNDGSVQRLQMMVYPDVIPWKYVDEYPNSEARIKFYEIIETLSEMDFEFYGATKGEDAPYFKFSPDAQKIFIEWFYDLMQKVENEEEEPIISEHLGKYPSLMPSLALIYHLIEIAYGSSKGGDIPKHCAIQAAVCCEYLESHARRIYGMVTNAGEIHGEKLAKKIQEGKVTEPFTARDVYRKGWQMLKDKESVESAIECLIEKHWIREDCSGTSTDGGRPSVKYFINPKFS
ncbi:hypothetical protein MTBBW1_2620004 [Desulfamplus magnetovallimortis]|uniref:NrS-1 polymerase-like HBD domain-containing protein n=1 Tax=Desulfamplus magnetovallimortis TaxID=1246637 RepID=A0A1W1HEZ5_9BACT|nr:DUF3987 domain-containing protein [Desulfamplus magnetovallimortis]SLM31040.1 hypothetical protein MTBBW1_2620004 [Desulfamplus magnetovallimortis]